MGCGCGQRRRNVVTAARAISRGNVRAAIVEAKDFTRTAARDVRRLIEGTTAMAKYRALKRFQYDGSWYEIGADFEEDERNASALLDDGAIELVPEEEQPQAA